MRREISPRDDEWPMGLNELGPTTAPRRLFVEGRPLVEHEKAIAVVGTRRPTAAGLEAAHDFATGLAEAGFIVVSGLALGIDAAAHRAALTAGGQTIAVLGAGLDMAYPQRNRSLRREIEELGTVVTEYPEGTEPFASHFPERNRIIAGLCIGVVVIEGTTKSGALITARLALDANRRVWAVPGSIRNRQASGPNELIRSGNASLVTHVDHVFEDVSPSLVWGVNTTSGTSAAALDEEEIQVLSLLDDVPVQARVIGSESGLSLGAVGLILAKLEVRGLVKGRAHGYELTSTGGKARAAVTSVEEKAL